MYNERKQKNGVRHSVRNLPVSGIGDGPPDVRWPSAEEFGPPNTAQIEFKKLSIHCFNIR